MAYEPIVLGSNLIPGLGFGALPQDLNYYVSPSQGPREGTVENEDGTFTIPTYERTESGIPDSFDWSMYGTEYAPMLRYFNRVKNGEIIYDPNNDVVNEGLLGDGDGDGDGDGSGLPTEAEMIKQELIAFGKSVVAGAGAQIGRAYAQTGDLGESFDAYGKGGFTELLGLGANNDPTRLTSKISSSGPFDQGRAQFELASLDTDAGKAANLALKSTPKNPLDADASTRYLQSIEDNPNLNANAKNAAKLEYKTAMASIPEAPKSYLENITDRGKSFGKNATSAGRANLYGSAGAGLGAVAANLIAGKNLKESVKSGIKVGAGSYIGGLLFPGVGNFIGGLLGGRVICNELQRQGIMTRKQVALDYRFTRDYLTPTHVNGYHVWAVWMVRQMRKGRFVPFWKHVAGHRANEIAYIYGERAKPDYLGKAYRKILEPICWSIGFFCKKTDWTVLYKQKEV